jgi:hypothetical protein
LIALLEASELDELSLDSSLPALRRRTRYADLFGPASHDNGANDLVVQRLVAIVRERPK